MQDGVNSDHSRLRMRSVLVAAVFVVALGLQAASTCPTTAESDSFYGKSVQAVGVCANSNTHCSGSEAAGNPDEDYVSLGGEGHIIVTMKHPLADGAGPDLRVYEMGDATPGFTSEGFNVYVSSNKTRWHKVATRKFNDSGKTYASIDLGGLSGSYTYVKVEDCWTDYPWEGPSTGADIDAIEGLYRAIPVDDSEPPLLDCPSDTEVDSILATSPSYTGYATATDNIDPVPKITHSDSNASLCPRVIERAWRATDACGNVSTCVQRIVVNSAMDSDCDDVPDSEDVCPNDPDCDKDGVQDGLDSCPGQAGPASNGGCPEDLGEVCADPTRLLFGSYATELCGCRQGIADLMYVDRVVSSPIHIEFTSDGYRLTGELAIGKTASQLAVKESENLRLTTKCEIAALVEIRTLQAGLSMVLTDEAAGYEWTLVLSDQRAAFQESATQSPEWVDVPLAGQHEIRIVFDYGQQEVKGFVDGVVVGMAEIPRNVSYGTVSFQTLARDNMFGKIDLDLLAVCIARR